MFSYKSIKNDYNSKRSLLIYNIVDSINSYCYQYGKCIKKNLPNAKKICFVPNNSKNNLIIKILKKNNVLIIKKKSFLNMNVVSSRFLYEYEYLKKYKFI